MFRLTAYRDAIPGKDDLANYVSSRASATIAAATQFIFGMDYITGDIDDQEVFESTYGMLFSGGSFSTEGNPVQKEETGGITNSHYSQCHAKQFCSGWFRGRCKHRENIINLG